MGYKSNAAPYRAQILRMWAEQHGNRLPQWRFSLEDVETRERTGFADLDALIHYLLALMDAEETGEPESNQ